MDWLMFNANLNLNDNLKLMKFCATEPRKIRNTGREMHILFLSRSLN